VIIGALFVVVAPCYVWSQEDPNAASTGNTTKSKAQKNKSTETDEEPTETTVGALYSAPRKMEMQFGMRFYSNDNYCTKLHATIPFPINWPEQTVNIVSSDIPGNVAWSWRDLPGIAKQPTLVRQLVMDIPSLSPNNELHLLVNVSIEKQFIDPPPDTTVFVIPTKVPSELNWFTKSSPYIDIELQRKTPRQPGSMWRRFMIGSAKTFPTGKGKFDKSKMPSRIEKETARR
jgi:hypothetical protein